MIYITLLKLKNFNNNLCLELLHIMETNRGQITLTDIIVASRTMIFDPKKEYGQNQY